MKDTYVSSPNRDPLTVCYLGKCARISDNTEKKDKSVSQEEQTFLEQDNEDSNERLVFLTNLSEKAENYSITEHSIIKRNGDIIFNNFNRILKDTVVLSGLHGYGVTTTAMYVAQRIAKGKCPKKFEDTIVISIDYKNFMYAQSVEEIYIILLEILNTIHSNGVNKLIVFFDNFEMVSNFVSNYNTIIEDINEEIGFDMLKFLIGIKTDFISSLSDENKIELFKCSTLINVELKPNVKEIINVIKPKIFLLCMMHSNIKISDYYLEVFGLMLLSNLGNLINYKNVLNGIDGLLSICENAGDKKITRKHIREYFYYGFQSLEARSYNQNLRIAQHEAGHTVVGLALSYIIDMEGVVIVGDGECTEGKAIGVYRGNLGEDRFYDKQTIIDQIAFNLAGRVGQGTIDVQACSDLQKATEFARKLLEEIGCDMGNNYVFDISSDTISEEFIVKYEKKMIDLLEEGRIRAEVILRNEKDVYNEIVEKLVKKYYLTGTELQQIWKKYHK